VERPGVIAVDHAGDLQFASELARRLVAGYFRAPLMAQLPAQVREWLSASPRCGDKLTVPGPEGQLDIHLLSAGPYDTPLLELRERRSGSAAARLTAREHQVMARVAVGETNHEIARALRVSPRTVENHLRAAYRKLGVTNRTAAAAAVSGDGLSLPAV
jgi:DNA-binding CsgD family transcriptional regulator